MVTINQKAIFPIGLGTWHMGDDPQKRTQEIQALRAGLDHGATVIDTAEMYGEGNAERLVGEAIQPYHREDLYLISKVYPWHASREQLPICLDHSLQRLGTDYLDMYLLHWRGNIPLVETVEALEKAKQAGKIRAWGVSNFDVADMEELMRVTNGQNCQTNQVLYNLSERGIEFDLLPYMQQHQLPLIAYSPIAQGDSLGGHLTEQRVLQEASSRYFSSSLSLVYPRWTNACDSSI